MGRPPRLNVPGGHYHVTLRGNHREALFATRGDRRVLDDIVGEALAATGARVHAYCWMTNHLHALVQATESPLAIVMQRIAKQYSGYRHRRLDTTGHLFERRYGARLIDDDRYFLTAIRYIHLNPCTAGLVTDPASYPWSSHTAYLGTRTVPWLTTAFGLSLLFDGPEARAREAYRHFMEEADAQTDEEPPSAAGRQAAGPQPPTGPKGEPAFELDRIAHEVCCERMVNPALLRSPAVTRDLTATRAEIARRALAGRVATVGEVAAHFGRTPSAITQLLKRYRV